MGSEIPLLDTIGKEERTIPERDSGLPCQKKAGFHSFQATGSINVSNAGMAKKSGTYSSHRICLRPVDEESRET